MFHCNGWWFPWTLARYAEVIERSQSPSFLAGKKFVFEKKSELRNLTDGPGTFDSFSDYLKSGDQWRWYGVSSFVIRRDVFEASGGFREGLVNGEDAELALRIGCASNFTVVTSPFTFGYRSHESNVTKDLSRNVESGLHLISMEEESKLPGGSLRAYERYEILCGHLRPTSLDCLKHKNFQSDGWRIYQKTLRWHLQLRRFKYLLGFPLQFVASYFKKFSDNK
jgi:hypothetical protein